MARSEGFEPPALGIEIRCSIQLSYERIVFSTPKRLALVMAMAFRRVRQGCSHLAANFSIPRQPARRRDGAV
jgi:hypothetical protein